ncbi:hypothetical protein JT359_00900 [Candidatus Poribacteria bacterium]|nr:hypothetical protein [Candidatus Poribacteria bacterium]
MQDISLNFQSDSLLLLTDKLKASVEGRMSWGDTFGIGLGGKNKKHLIVWTPKETSESQILPAFDSEDGQLTLKMKHRPGAWVSWIDETKIQNNALDDYDRVNKSIQELERNIRQISDFADGVITDITVQHLGKSLTLSDLTEEVLQSRLVVPNTIKTGAYVLTSMENAENSSSKVVIPEQTHINRLHLNEDIVLTEIENGAYDTVLSIVRTHIKNYPDLIDLGSSLSLQNQFRNDDEPNADPSVRVLPTAAVYNPLEPKQLRLVSLQFTATQDDIENTITESTKKIEDYMGKVNQHAYNLMTEFHQGVESRLKALMLNNGQRIHNKVWDDLVIQELKNTMSAFTEYYKEYIGEEFDQDSIDIITTKLTECIDLIIQSWHLQETQQYTLNHMIQSSYTITNQICDFAVALYHDMLFEKDFISTGFVNPVNVTVLQDDVVQDELSLPEWTSGTIREKLTGIGLSSSMHPSQIERLRKVWLALLEIANHANQHSCEFEGIIEPIQTVILATKSSPNGRSTRTGKQKQQTFPGFDVDESDLNEILTEIESNFTIIKQWIEHAPSESKSLNSYFTTMWALILNGKYRERLLGELKPTCEINLSVPDQTKRLINLTLGSQLVIENEKDRKTLERNLNRALAAKTGYNLRDITNQEKLAIHGDMTLALLREELERYDESLTKKVSRSVTPSRKSKKRNSNNGKNNDNLTPENIKAEQMKVQEMIEFLKPYGEAKSIRILAKVGLNRNTSELEQIRKKQVLSFDLNELPSISETWLTDIKTSEDYPNLRVFLLQNELPISTTGRILMELKNNLPESLFNQVLGLIQEVKELQKSSYEGEPLDRFISYISEKVWRWELTQITTQELPVVVKEKVLTSAICYEKEVENLMEYVERYDELLETKLKADSEMDVQREKLETRFQEIVESLL